MEPSSGFYWDPVLVLDFKGWEPIQGVGRISTEFLSNKQNARKSCETPRKHLQFGLKFSKPAPSIAARHVSIIDRVELKLLFKMEAAAGKNWCKLFNLRACSRHGTVAVHGSKLFKSDEIHIVSLSSSPSGHSFGNILACFRGGLLPRSHIICLSTRVWVIPGRLSSGIGLGCRKFGRKGCHFNCPIKQ